MKILSVSDLHAQTRWVEWLQKTALSYDALFLPGDLLDGMPPHEGREKKEVLAMLQILCAQGLPVFLCTGNHDGGLWDLSDGIQEQGLIDLLVREQDSLPKLVLDGESGKVGEITVQCIAYGEPLPLDTCGVDIWLIHEPPDETPLSIDYSGCAMGNFELIDRARTDPNSLPPLIIGGHVHSAPEWHHRQGNTLFLNSGQDLRAAVPHHFEIFVDGIDIKIQHHPSREITRI